MSFAAATGTADSRKEWRDSIGEARLLLSIESSEFPLLFERRDSTFSVNSDYSDENGHDEQNSTLNAWQGAALLTADCLGTGLLALPNNIYTLGVPLGLGFLICNLPINYYAGWIFHRSALAIEEQHVRENLAYSSASNTTVSKSSDTDVDDEGHEQSQRNYQSVSNRPTDDNNNNNNDKSAAKIDTTAILVEQPHQQQQQRSPPPAMLHHDTATYDFIGMTAALFPDNKTATRRVMGIYYTNIFLVMGNYILVMSHAVAAAVGEERVSLPVAGLIAATAMFVVLSQFRTMAKLGRYASLVSLSALLTVVLQCLWEVRQQQRLFPMILPPPPFETVIATESTIMHRLRKLSALGSIGFSIGSQKLFLNIRHELTDRRDAPKSLAISLSVFGTAYVLLVAAAGPNPPGFLFDAIPVHTWNRHVAGILLWMHVVVSYAINSQAICSSMDRLLWKRVTGRIPVRALAAYLKDTAGAALRWIILTFVMAATAYTVANAIPFFTDLVGLIGAVTSVPLTLLLPAILWRKHLRVPLWMPTTASLASISLVYFSLAFMIAATVGSLYSIRQDWLEH